MSTSFHFEIKTQHLRIVALLGMDGVSWDGKARIEGAAGHCFTVRMSRYQACNVNIDQRIT